jgi:hypothetical protein
VTSQAQRAADYLHSLQPQRAQESEESERAANLAAKLPAIRQDGKLAISESLKSSRPILFVIGLSWPH